MSNDTLVIFLALATLGAGAVWGVWQIMRTRRSQAEGHKSAMTESAEAGPDRR